MSGSTGDIHDAVEYIQAQLTLHASQTAQVEYDTGEQISFGEISRRAYNIGHNLQERGMGPGQVVGLFVGNDVHTSSLILGVLQCGATAALYSPSVTLREMEHLISLTKPSVAIAPVATPEQMQFLTNNIPDVFGPGSLDYTTLMQYTNEEAIPYVRCQVRPDDVALLLSSSGSTGLPKAVILTHDNLLWALTTLSWTFLEPGSPAMGLAPFFHAYGLGIMLMALCCGAPLIILKKFTMPIFIKAIKKYKISHLHLVPSLLYRLADDSVKEEDLSPVEVVYTGAGPICPRLVTSVRTKLSPTARIFHSYGMTETTHVVFMAEIREDKPTSCGKLLSYVSAKIVDENGREVAPGEQGELFLAGPMVTPGYYQNQPATEESFMEGWLRTGDLAFIDTDGYVFIVDRIKDIIKYQGYQISATEVEKVILEECCALEVAVVGVEHPVYGEVPRAFIVRHTGSTLTEDQVKQTVSKELSHYKWLRGGVRFVESLPKTHSMKVLRKVLRNYP